MRVISIGSDSTLCDQQSAAFKRAATYAAALDQLLVIIPTTRRGISGQREGNLYVLPAYATIRLIAAIVALWHIGNMERPDVITTQDPFEMGLIGLFAARVRRVPLHVQVHTDFLSREFRAHSWKNRLRVMLAGFVIRHAAHIRVVSVHLKEEIEKAYHPHARISVLPIFVDTERFRALTHRPHEQFGVSLLFVGRLEKEKRADVAVRALARARALGIDAGLTIVGDGSQEKYLRLLVQELGIADGVVFAGRQDPLEYYAHADMLLVPSEYEGYGMVVIEALAARVFVLATDVGVAREAGAHIAPHGTDGFAGELCSLLAHAQIPKGELLHHPYRDFAEYADMWVADVCLATQSH